VPICVSFQQGGVLTLRGHPSRVSGTQGCVPSATGVDSCPLSVFPSLLVGFTQGRVSRLSYSTMEALRRPLALVSISFPYSTTLSSMLRSLVSRSPSGDGEDAGGRDSQLPEQSQCPLAVLFDPGRADSIRPFIEPMLSPRPDCCQPVFVQNEDPWRLCAISGLYHTVFGFAVYASCRHCCATTQDSLPVERPLLAGRA
jgi:hypothetical protein